MKNNQKSILLRLLLALFWLSALSACSTLTAHKENRLKGHPFSGTTNNLSAWYCESSDLMQETQNLSGRTAVRAVIFPVFFLSNTSDLIFSATSDAFVLPYSLFTDPEKTRSKISDCSSGVWTLHY
ncbi:MAG: hypothetical protein ACPW60_07220 [Methylohalobius sp. ZOD2]